VANINGEKLKRFVLKLTIIDGHSIKNALMIYKDFTKET
jgi:hypothetical protein